MSPKPWKPPWPPKPPNGSKPPSAGSRVPEHVIGLPALRVGQHLVRLVDLLEAGVRLLGGIHVGVPLLGELAERALYVLVRGSAGHAQDVVVITLGGHLARV